MYERRHQRPLSRRLFLARLARHCAVAALLLGVAYLLPEPGGPGELVLLATLGLTLEAFAWGMFLSAYSRSVLAAASAAAVAVAVLWLFTFLLADSSAVFSAILVRVLLVPLALAGSRRRYCRDDRQRLGGGRAVGGRTALLWLAFRIISYTYGPLLGVFATAFMTDWRLPARRVIEDAGLSRCHALLAVDELDHESTVGKTQPSGLWRPSRAHV